jgi:hypothetical protein
MTTGDRDQKLESALRALADETSGAGASPEVQTALLHELRARRQPSPKATWPWFALAGCAAAAGLFLMLAPARRPQPPAAQPASEFVVALPPVMAKAPEIPVAPAARPQPPRPVVQRASLREQPLTPWYYNQALPPARSGQVLRVKVSREIAASFGALPVRNSGDIVTADLLIGEDGMARAIRFVQ